MAYVGHVFRHAGKPLWLEGQLRHAQARKREMRRADSPRKMENRGKENKRMMRPSIDRRRERSPLSLSASGHKIYTSGGDTDERIS